MKVGGGQMGGFCTGTGMAGGRRSSGKSRSALLFVLVLACRLALVSSGGQTCQDDPSGDYVFPESGVLTADVTSLPAPPNLTRAPSLCCSLSLKVEEVRLSHQTPSPPPTWDLLGQPRFMSNEGARVDFLHM